MAGSKQRRLENAVAAVQQHHGPRALRRGGELSRLPAVPHLSTGFSGLDAITGCGGVPLGMLTLLSGRSTSGKLTLAYKLLANAQRAFAPGGVPSTVILLDLGRTADPDYVVRCGVDLEHLLVARPSVGPNAVNLIADLLQQYHPRAMVVDGLADLATDRAVLHHLNTSLGKLQRLLRATGCALVILDEPRPPWLRWLNLDAASLVRWAAALHIEMQREHWLRQNGEMTGYRALARLLKSRWMYGIRSAPVEIIFNGTVRARETW
ncbi:MAG: hypothetical protein H3C34_12105 [Caldilineaceae bacterium]|nr:hypothetical protein [Caldilineaceae bacterium]